MVLILAETVRLERINEQDGSGIPGLVGLLASEPSSHDVAMGNHYAIRWLNRYRLGDAAYQSTGTFAMNRPTSPTKAIVLVVEDEPLLRLLAVDFIEEAGFEVVEAASADAAVDILEARTDIRIVFTDIAATGRLILEALQYRYRHHDAAAHGGDHRASALALLQAKTLADRVRLHCAHGARYAL